MTALDGVRVVEAGLLVQGPQAAAMLGLLGAEVIKVELPNIGDQSRWLPVAPAHGDFRSAFFIACNRGKRSLSLDLRNERGREAFLRLIETADVLITNFQPGTMDGWGLGYDVLSARNPGLVYAAGSAFGALGPDASRTGADLSAQASGGLIHGTGTDDGEPTPVAVTIADHISSQNLVVGILAAVRAERDRTRATRRRVVAGQPDLGPGERVHLLPPQRIGARSLQQGPPDDRRHLRHLPDLRRMDRSRRGHRSAARRFLRAARTT